MRIVVWWLVTGPLGWRTTILMSLARRTPVVCAPSALSLDPEVYCFNPHKICRFQPRVDESIFGYS